MNVRTNAEAKVALATEDEVLAACKKLDEVRTQVARVFVGTSDALDVLLIALVAQGHVLVEGVPGVAKTTLAKTFATTLGCDMSRIQFTPDLLPADITGTYVLDPREATFTLRRGPIFANIVLADEVNRAPAKTQSALLEAMAEGQSTIEGSPQKLPVPFMVLATQNPIDFEGTYPLPEAQLDRFLLRLNLGYPSEKAEVAMLQTHHRSAPEPNRVLSQSEVLSLQDVARRIFVEDDIEHYIVALCRGTRTHPRVLLGASPRASLGLLHSAKAHAMIRGRHFVIPDDVQAVAPAVLTHRLILTPDLEGDEQARESVVLEILDRIPHLRRPTGGLD